MVKERMMGCRWVTLERSPSQGHYVLDVLEIMSGSLLQKKDAEIGEE